MMDKIKLTVNFIKRLVPGQNARYADSEVPGLQIRVGANSVSYYLRKRQGQKVHEIVLGRHPDITLEEARQKALEKLGALANYQEIEAPSARRQPLVRDAVELLLSNVSYPVKVSSVLKRWEFIFDKKICDLQPELMKQTFDSMADVPSVANHSVRYLKTAFNKIARQLNIPSRSDELFEGITLHVEKPRLRFLQEDEAPKIIDAIKSLRSNYRYAAQADALLVMLYTGQRKSRVLHMHADQINRDFRIWSVPGNKNKLPVEHNINDEAWEIIEPRLNAAQGGYLFLWRGKPMSDCRKTLLKACQMCGISGLDIHDLRRSLGTWMLTMGVPIASVSKTLGHSSIRVTEQVYAHVIARKMRDDTMIAIEAMKKGKIE